MLVVDGVVLEPVEQSEQMGELECRCARIAQKDLDAGDKVVEIRHLREDVVSDDQARALPVGDELSSDLRSEERDEGLHSALLGSTRDIDGGIDSESRNCRANEVL